MKIFNMITKYNINDLIRLISENKSSDEIALFYNVSGRTVRNWLSKEKLKTNVRYKGYSNILNLTELQKKTRNDNLIKAAKNKIKAKISCICEMCNSEYKVKESVYKLGTRFCSKKCVSNFLFKNGPENHPRWLGGKSQENQIGRANNEYCEWRISVFKKDRFTCQKCLLTGKKLNAHHIDNWSEHEDKRYLLTNGITLCKECHKEIHKIYGQKTNKEHLDVFLGVKTINGWKRSNLETF